MSENWFLGLEAALFRLWSEGRWLPFSRLFVLAGGVTIPLCWAVAALRSGASMSSSPAMPTNVNRA
jgi:hypothetical protein